MTQLDQTQDKINMPGFRRVICFFTRSHGALASSTHSCDGRKRDSINMERAIMFKNFARWMAAPRSAITAPTLARKLSHFVHHSLPVKKMHPFQLDLHFFFPPIGSSRVSGLAQFLIGQVEFAGGFGEMSLQAVTKTNLAVKTRTRDRVGVSSKDLSAAQRIARFLVPSNQSQDIAKTFVQSQPAFTKLLFAERVICPIADS